ncbi:hypothetical protein NP493_270g01030 [Ridgeia piscesae]|uniref:Coiled-coil domain containing 9 n=1 Tax=Ridgeia piscesae TaxID=27915 RepID=A0AAD9NXI5_RIDPI|nr:hypothetical protein NP493_270g01030 [Ridgeia piscesae]
MKFPPLLSKEEKEALLDKKIEEMRRKNAAKERRFREVEEDKKAFESTVHQRPVSPSAAAETQRQPHANGVSGGAKTRLGMGRGRRLEKMSKQKLHAPEYEAKKQQRQQQQDEADSETGPPPDPGYRFLSDPYREGPLSRDPQKPPDQGFRRHPRNFGGDTDFEAIPSKVKQEKEKQSRQQARAPRSERDAELQMTGRERRKYSEWKSERQKIDQDRINRHRRKDTGEWRREWDTNKQDQG